MNYDDQSKLRKDVMLRDFQEKFIPGKIYCIHKNLYLPFYKVSSGKIYVRGLLPLFFVGVLEEKETMPIHSRLWHPWDSNNFLCTLHFLYEGESVYQPIFWDYKEKDRKVLGWFITPREIAPPKKVKKKIGTMAEKIVELKRAAGLGPFRELLKEYQSCKTKASNLRFKAKTLDRFEGDKLIRKAEDLERQAADLRAKMNEHKKFKASY